MKKSVCIIPFYNEEKRIDFSKFEEAFSNKDIFFCLVDDGSKDNTLELLYNFKKQHNNIQVIKNKSNVGKAETIRLAMLELITDAEVEYVGFLDCDFATPFYEYARLNKLIKEKEMEVVFGSRIKLYGKDIERNASRHYFSRIFTTIANILFSLEIYDTQCGCKIFHKVLISDAFSKKFLSKWLFDIEIFTRLFSKNKKVRILEEGLYEWKEIGGSKIKITDFLKFPFELFYLFYKYRIRKYYEKN